MFGKILKVLFLAALIAGGFYFYQQREKGQVFDAVRPKTGPAVEAVYATGTVEPSVMVPVAPRSSARLMALLADEGMQVKKGQVLAQLEDEDLQKTLSEMRAGLDLAEKEYRRRAALYKKDAAPKDVVDQALANLETAKARVAQAEANISYMRLVAPEDGTVIRRDGEVGSMISSGTPVFFMACCSGFRVSAEVDEEDIAEVRPGQKVVIRADAFPGKVFDGAVQSITPKGDPVARSYRVRVSLAADTPLLIGMTAETNIVLSEKNDAMLVPPSAVHAGTVFVAENGKSRRRKVETGVEGVYAVEIKSGLSLQDVVLKSPPADMPEGKALHVRIVDWQAE